MTKRIVFDTNTVVSALLFANGRLSWLRQHWREAGCIPLVSRTTVEELSRVFAYPKFRLTPDEAHELLAEYLVFCEIVKVQVPCRVLCRDPKDQPFLDLAQGAQADLLVTGDADLLELATQTAFRIETPEAYRRGVSAL